MHDMEHPRLVSIQGPLLSPPIPLCFLQGELASAGSQHGTAEVFGLCTKGRSTFRPRQTS